MLPSSFPSEQDLYQAAALLYLRGEYEDALVRVQRLLKLPPAIDTRVKSRKRVWGEHRMSPARIIATAVVRSKTVHRDTRAPFAGHAVEVRSQSRIRGRCAEKGAQQSTAEASRGASNDAFPGPFLFFIALGLTRCAKWALNPKIRIGTFMRATVTDLRRFTALQSTRSDVLGFPSLKRRPRGSVATEVEGLGSRRGAREGLVLNRRGG